MSKIQLNKEAFPFEVNNIEVVCQLGLRSLIDKLAQW